MFSEFYFTPTVMWSGWLFPVMSIMFLSCSHYSSSCSVLSANEYIIVLPCHPSSNSSLHESLSLASSTISRSVSSTPERKSAVSFELSLTGIIPILANWEKVKAESYNLSLNLPCLSWQNLRLQNLPYFFGSTWLSSIWSLASLEEQFPLSSSWFWHC